MKSCTCWSKNTTHSIAKSPGRWRNKNDYAYRIVDYGEQTRGGLKPLPSARPEGACQPVSLIPSAPYRGSGPLGHFFTHMGGDPLRRCANGASAFLCRSHAHSCTTDRTRFVGSDDTSGGAGRPDAVSGPARSW